MRLLQGLILLLAWPFVGHAQELYEPFRGIRSLGMGGVVISIVNDAEAVFHNPAALGRVEGLNIHLLELGLGGRMLSPEDLEAIQNIDSDDPSTYNDLFGTRLNFKANGALGLALPYFGVGYYTDYDLSLELHNPGYPEFTTYFKNDSAVTIGAAYPIAPKSYIGMSLKRMTRWGGATQELGLTTVANAGDIQGIMDEFENKGQGYGVDLALLTEVPAPLNPVLTVVWQDVGSTAFTQTGGADAPPHVPQNLSAGASIGFDLPGLDWVIAMEGRHLLEPDVQIGKKVHIGTEVSIPFLDIRAGINQGYITYGVGFDFLIFRLDAASYTEELGIYPGQTADNRVMIGLSIDLGFDANFNFTDNSGKKRKLKQRR
ncbi:hypothetical protein ACES2L_12865 [Bdellovibrio bacteriovorus]